MNCPRCGEKLSVLVDEPMGEIDVCAKCDLEVTIYFDKHPIVQRVHKHA